MHASGATSVGGINEVSGSHSNDDDVWANNMARLGTWADALDDAGPLTISEPAGSAGDQESGFAESYEGYGEGDALADAGESGGENHEVHGPAPGTYILLNYGEVPYEDYEEYTEEEMAEASTSEVTEARAAAPAATEEPSTGIPFHEDIDVSAYDGITVTEHIGGAEFAQGYNRPSKISWGLKESMYISPEEAQWLRSPDYDKYMNEQVMLGDGSVMSRAEAEIAIETRTNFALLAGPRSNVVGAIAQAGSQYSGGSVNDQIRAGTAGALLGNILSTPARGSQSRAFVANARAPFPDTEIIGPSSRTMPQRVFYGGDRRPLMTSEQFDEYLLAEQAIPGLARAIKAQDARYHVVAVGLLYDAEYGEFFFAATRNSGQLSKAQLSVAKRLGVLTPGNSLFFDDAMITTRTGGLKIYQDAEANMVGYADTRGMPLLSVGSFPLPPCSVCSPMLMANGVQIVPIQ